MHKQLGKIPSALFPLNNETILDYLYNQYKDSIEGIYIVVSEKKELIEDYIRWKSLDIHTVETAPDGDLGSSVRDGLRRVLKDHPEATDVIVNFGDTYLEDADISDMSGDIIYYASAPRTSEWTFFEQENGHIAAIDDKPAAASSEMCDLFVGTLCFADSWRFLQCLEKSTAEKSNTIGSFYRSILSYSADSTFRFIKTEKWIDTGHSENYYRAKAGVAARAFNTIEIDENKGTMVKRSNNVDKFLYEINWYLKIPNSLQYLLPRVYDYSLDKNNPFIEMEYYGYHTLHEMLIFGDFPLIKWHHLMERLLFVVKDMGQYALTGIGNEAEAAMREIYIEKTESRMSELRGQPEFADFFINPITVNGTVYPCLDEILKKLPELIERIVLIPFDGRFTIIHGDLCFSNILVEENYNYMRVVDPRGKFGQFDIFGDPRYELAKLMHSLDGNYDCIIEDMFSIARNGTSLDYSVSQKANNVFKLFCEVFADRLDDIRAIRLIEATLFLSMIPLHSDKPERQYAMLATGLMLLKRVVDNDKEMTK